MMELINQKAEAYAKNFSSAEDELLTEIEANTQCQSSTCPYA